VLEPTSQSVRGLEQHSAPAQVLEQAQVVRELELERQRVRFDRCDRVRLRA